MGNTNIISIHAPSRERPARARHSAFARHFNPRSLAGATPTRRWFPQRWSEFQSTLPRGSDQTRRLGSVDKCISIHAPSRERQHQQYSTEDALAFQSTLPRGSDYRGVPYMAPVIISIHAPSRERRYLCFF